MKNNPPVSYPCGRTFYMLYKTIEIMLLKFEYLLFDSAYPEWGVIALPLLVVSPLCGLNRLYVL